MSTSSTNKLPLLADRPLLSIVGLRDTTSPVDGSDPGVGSVGALLVDCTGNDGAIIDDIWLIQRVGSNLATVNLYLSTSGLSLGVTATGGAANAWFLANATINTALGTTVHFTLPKLLAPVPHAGSNVDGEPPQFRGLYLPRGLALWAAVASETKDAAAPNIACQGGFY